MNLSEYSKYTNVYAGIQYALQVQKGEILVCRYVHLAIDRFFRDLENAEAPESLWQFRPDLAERAMKFAGLLVNIKGPLANQRIKLMDWQTFLFTNIFGFVERSNNRIRRFRQATVYVPRGNGKTTVAAPIALYLSFMDGEGGAEGYAAAVTRDQARILFDTCQHMVRRSPVLQERYGVTAAANSIFQENSASKFVPVSSDAKALDGLNVQVAVCDEIGSHKTSEVYDVILTAMGKRSSPFLLNISTATGNNSGIGKQLWDYLVRVLEGTQEDDRLFGMIYSLDIEDDPWEESNWIKANPSWGQAVQPDAIRSIMKQARNNPAQESVAKTRHLNLWQGADEALFSMRSWRECYDPGLSLENMDGCECHIALDLASKTDLAAVALLFSHKDDEGRTIYQVFVRCYLNDSAIMEARNPSYPGWAAEGHIIVTPGNETDFGQIEEDVRDFCRRFRVSSIAYDPWGSTQFAQRLLAEGAPMVEFRATTQNFSEPTKELDAAIRSGRIQHDGNPVLEWCLGNVVGRYDARSNVYPRKSRSEQKIDAAIALIMTIGRSIVPTETNEPEYQMIFA